MPGNESARRSRLLVPPQWLFAHGAAPDCHVLTESGLSPLALACRVQCLPLVRWLLSLGVDINGGGGPWISPLFCATMFSRGGSPEVPLFLIDQGAETRNTSTANKRTVTHAAAENGLVPILEALHSVQLAEERELHVMRIPPLLRRMTKEGFLEHVLQVMEGMVDDAELSPAELRNELRADFGHLWDDSPVATRTAALLWAISRACCCRPWSPDAPAARCRCAWASRVRAARADAASIASADPCATATPLSLVPATELPDAMDVCGRRHSLCGRYGGAIGGAGVSGGVGGGEQAVLRHTTIFSQFGCG